jgi:hypothetical protein
MPSLGLGNAVQTTNMKDTLCHLPQTTSFTAMFWPEAPNRSSLVAA